MALIALVHALLVDVCRMPNALGFTIAVLASAGTFAFYHDLSDGATGSLDSRKLAFFILAGLYLALLFVTRGFGIVVGAHVAYDVVAVLFSDPGTASV